MRILIIEDDRDAAAYLLKALREAGHSADHAADGVTGYDLAHEGGYDVAIVDRMLPKMDGLSLISALRAQGNETPVLILSALGQVDDRRKKRSTVSATSCSTGCLTRSRAPERRSCCSPASSACSNI
jgi:two-component system OmpR family response regulator